MISLARILFFCSLMIAGTALSAQTIDFNRPVKAGEVRTARLRLKLSREYTFMIPGAGDSIKTVETMDLVMLTRIRILKLNEKSLPVNLEIEPEILGGTLNGRAIVPEELTGKKILADLSRYPCTFRSADGSAISRNGQIILASLFRVQFGASYSKILGPPRPFKPRDRWTPDIKPILKSLAGRELREEISASQIQSAAQMGPLIKIDGINCTSVDLTFRSMGTHSYDFRTTVRLVLPVDKKDGGPVSLHREGVEVVDRKVISGDPAAAGASVRLVTTEQLEVVYASGSRAKKPEKKKMFQDIFR